MEVEKPVELARVAEPEFQYGAEVFDAHQQETAKSQTKDKVIRDAPAKSGKSR